MDIIKRLYTPSMMIRKSEQLGPMPPAKEAMATVFKMAWPAIFQGIVLHLCGMVDTMMVGVVGTEAITAVGVSGVPRQLVGAFYTALTMAVSAIVARRIGEEKKEAANETLKQVLVYSLLLSLLICIPGYIFAPTLMRLCGAPASILPDAAAYFRIWIVGAPLWGASIVFTSAFSAAGRPKITMVALIAANLVNVGFNYLLIGGNLGFPALGVRGAAFSTFLCYVVQLGIGLFFALQKKSNLRLVLKTGFSFDRGVFRSVCIIAPAQLLAGLISFAAGTIQTRIVNSIGSADSFAAYQITLTLFGIFVSVAAGFSTAAGVLIGQSLGQNRPDISKVYVRLCILFSIIFSMVFVLFFGLFDEFTIGLYVPDRVGDAATFDAALTMLWILVFSMPINVLLQVFWGALQGAGDIKFTSALTFFSFACRTLFFFIFCRIPAIGVIGTLLAILVDDTSRMIMCYLRYRSGRWKEIML